MRTLTFTAIVDSRFDKDLEAAMEKKRQGYAKAIKGVGCEFRVSSVEEINFPAEKPYYSISNRNGGIMIPHGKKQREEMEKELTAKYGDGWAVITPEPSKQLRCYYWVEKPLSRKITWNDVMGAINSVCAVPYKYV